MDIDNETIRRLIQGVEQRNSADCHQYPTRKRATINPGGLAEQLSTIEPQMAHHLGKGHQFLQTLNF